MLTARVTISGTVARHPGEGSIARPDQDQDCSTARTNALAETINGLYKNELIKPRRPWKTLEQVELATAEWLDWLNHRRLYPYCGDIPHRPSLKKRSTLAHEPSRRPS